MTSQNFSTTSNRWYQSNTVRVFGMMVSATIVSLAMHPAAQAASLNLSSWTRFGDVQISGSQTNLSNAVNTGDDDFDANNNPVNRNLSSVNPLLANDLESSLGLPFGLLGLNTAEGSAIQTNLSGVVAGDRLQFNWVFQTFDNLFVDRPFVAINNDIFNLSSGNLFSYTFTNNGNYRIAIGLVDVEDFVGSSVLGLSNATFTPIPSPAMLPGMIATGLQIWRRKRQHK
jgi:hypothetical protein